MKVSCTHWERWASIFRSSRRAEASARNLRASSTVGLVAWAEAGTASAARSPATARNDANRFFMDSSNIEQGSGRQRRGDPFQPRGQGGTGAGEGEPKMGFGAEGGAGDGGHAGLFEEVFGEGDGISTAGAKGGRDVGKGVEGAFGRPAAEAGDAVEQRHQHVAPGMVLGHHL